MVQALNIKKLISSDFAAYPLTCPFSISYMKFSLSNYNNFKWGKIIFLIFVHDWFDNLNETILQLMFGNATSITLKNLRKISNYLFCSNGLI